MTAFNSKSGGFQLTTVGRVQTPTLAIIVEREEKIRKHVSRPYWEVKASFAATAGEYDGKASIGKVNVDNNPQTAMKYGIRSIPTLLVFKNGEIVDRAVGAVPKSTLVQKLDGQLA